MRIFTAGNEAGDYTSDEFAAYLTAESSTFNQGGGYKTAAGKGGDYYFYIPSGWGLKKDLTTGTMVVPGLPGSLGLSECYVKFHFNCQSRSDGTWDMFRFLDAAGNVLLKLHAADGGSGGSPGGLLYIYGYRGDGVTFAAPAQYGFRNDVWLKVEMYLKMGASGGVWTLWVNDIMVWTATGNIAGPAAQLYFTQIALVAVNLGGGSQIHAFDNIVINAVKDGVGTDISGTINNGRGGNGVLTRQRPVASGTTSQLTNDYGTSTNNFLHVRDLAAQNPTGFVGTNTAGNKDTYAIQAPSADFRAVNVVKAVAYATRNGPSITHMKFAVKPAGGSEIDAPSGAGLVLSPGGYGYVSQHFELNGAVPFVPADLGAGAEAGPIFAT